MTTIIRGCPITDIQDVPEGSSVLGSYAIGATQLSFPNVDDFGEEGICAIKVGTDPDGEPIYDSYTYTLLDPYADLSDAELEDLVDDDDGTGTLQISPPLAVAIVDGDKVLSCNAWGKPELVRTAFVQLYADDPEPTPIDVPTGTRAYLEVGTYQAGSLVNVESVGLTYRLVTMPTEDPVLDGRVIDPATIPEPAGLATAQDAIDAIEDDIAATNALVASGGSTIASAINKNVTDFNAGLATKSKHTLSLNVPGTTANNAGDVWERYKVVTAEGDGTVVSPAENRIIGRWRGAGGTAWTAMDLDATYIPQLDIGTGTFGDLTGTRIVAKSIGVERLLVSSFDNLVNDPLFVQPLGAAWQAPSWASIAATGNRQGNGPALQITNTATLNFVYNLPLDNSKIEAGQALRVDVPVVSTVTHAEGLTRATIRFTLIDGSFSSVTLTGPAATANVWTSITGTAIAPASAVSFTIYIATNAGLTTGTTRFDTPKVTRAANAELIVDGSVLAKHVTADMVEGLLVTGRVLQTDAAAARGIKISTSGIIGYDSQAGSPTLGQAKFVVSPSTGLLTMIGGTIESALFVGGTFRTSVSPGTNGQIILEELSGQGYLRVNSTNTVHDGRMWGVNYGFSQTDEGSDLFIEGPTDNLTLRPTMRFRAPLSGAGSTLRYGIWVENAPLIPEGGLRMAGVKDNPASAAGVLTTAVATITTHKVMSSEAVTLTTNATGFATYTHNLGLTADAYRVQVQSVNNNALRVFTVTAKAANTVTIRVENPTNGAVLASGTAGVDITILA